VLAVRWYLRYGLSYRDVEELLAERGITVDHVTIYRWVQRFTPLLIDAARPCRHVPGDRWFVDETYVKVAGRWVYLYRVIDQFAGHRRAGLGAAGSGGHLPVLHPGAAARLATEVTTDRALAYSRALDDLVPAACHVMKKYANNPIESDHSRLKSRLRPMRGLKRLRCARLISAVHPEHPPRPLRTRDRGRSKLTGPDCLHRADPGDLTNRDQRSRLSRLRTTQQTPINWPVNKPHYTIV
jgi:transposase, IS6 family